MTSPSSGIVSGDLDHQISAATTLKQCFDGINGAISKLRNQTSALPTVFQGSSSIAALSVHEDLYSGVQNQCVTGDQQCQQIVKNAQAQLAVTQDHARQIQQVVSGASAGGSVGVINA
jgi:uncharacterized protein YukE